MTYDPKAVDELLDALTSAGTIWFDKHQPQTVVKIANLVNALRPPKPPKKYHVMPTFREAAKMAGAALYRCPDGEEYFYSPREKVGVIWRGQFDFLRDLTATDKPPGKIPAGKDCRIEDLRELISVVPDRDARVNLALSDMCVLIDAIKEKYGV